MTAIPTPINPNSLPRFGGYNPKRFARTTLINFGNTADFTVDSATITADTTNWLANDKTHFSGLIQGSTGSTYSIVKRHLAAPVDLSAKHVGVRFLVNPGTTGGVDDCENIDKIYMVLFDGAGHGYSYMLWLNSGVHEHPANWQTAYVVPTDLINNGLVGSTGTPNMAAITDVWLVMRVPVSASRPTVVWDQMWASAVPAQALAIFCFESGYGPAMKSLGYMSTLGLPGNLALEPNRVMQYLLSGHINLTQAKLVRQAGHFIYMYPRDTQYFKDGDPGGGADYDHTWDQTTAPDKLRKLRFTRQALTELGLIDDAGGYVSALAGSSWLTADETAFLGTELLYVPSEGGIQGYGTLASPDKTYGMPGGFATLYAADTTRIAAAAAGKALYMAMWHCADDASAALCCADIDACVSAGMKFITFRDLMTGNI